MIELNERAPALFFFLFFPCLKFLRFLFSFAAFAMFRGCFSFRSFVPANEMALHILVPPSPYNPFLPRTISSFQSRHEWILSDAAHKKTPHDGGVSCFLS